MSQKNLECCGMSPLQKGGVMPPHSKVGDMSPQGKARTSWRIQWSRNP